MFPSIFDTSLEIVNDTVLCRRYRVLETLDERAREASYLAHDAFTGGRVVLQVYDEERSVAEVRAWKRRARVLESLRHPGIAEYTDYFEHTGGRLVSTRTYVEGETLGRRLQRGESFSVPRVKRIAEQILDALVYLQGLNPPVAHGNISHDTVLLDAEERVLLMGFAHAGETLGEMESSLAWRDASSGQVPDGLGRSRDLYALGTMLLGLLCQTPPRDDSPDGVLSTVLLRLAPDDWFGEWLKRLVASSSDRFRSAAEARAGWDSPKPGLVKASPRRELSVPAGYGFEVYVQPGRFKVVIPGTGFFGRHSRGICVFAVVWSVFSGLTSLAALIGEHFSLLDFMAIIAFPATTVMVIYLAVFTMFGTTLVELDATEVRVVKTLGNRRKETRAPLESWQDAQVVRDDGTVLEYECNLSLGPDKVGVGRHLPQPELQWMANALNDEVRRLRDA
jgi:hypothetical protein